MQLDAPDAPKTKLVKRPRATTACLTCRKKRVRCSGEQPVCSGCAQYGRTCEWNLEGDKRKPYTREVVEALQQQIVSLEAQLSALSTNGGGGPTLGLSPSGSGGPLSPPSADTYVLPHSEDPVDGGLATNAHGEVRFYGPGSAMAVLADAAASTEALRAAQHAALTQAAAPQAEFDYAPPPTPPVLAPELQSRLLTNAFSFALAGFQLVDERAFYAQLIQDPSARTQHYSPFMLNVLLGIGCRYLDPAEAFPRAVCSDPNDSATRGDAFINFARYNLEREWNYPKISTLRALACLCLYLVGKRGHDGASWLYIGCATRVAENFGLHLGIHHLGGGPGGAIVDQDMITARRDAFYSIFGVEVFCGMHMARPTGTFRPNEFDQQLPPVDPIVDFDAPMYRSSAFHWSSKLAIIACKISAAVYAKRGIGLAARRNCVPALHLELQTWYHALPGHVKVSAADATKSPHPHVIAVNLLYWLTLLQLHRPFFSRVNHPNAAAPNSTEKCLLAASHIVRLIKVQQRGSGYRFVHPTFTHAAFAAGTILVLSASQTGISPSIAQDLQRQQQAAKDMKVVIQALKEAGATWSAAVGSAETLMALLAAPTPAPSTPPLTVTTVGEPLPSSLAPLLDPTASLPEHTLSLPPLDLSSLDPQLQQHALAQQHGTLQLGGGGAGGGGLTTGQQTPAQNMQFTAFSEQLFPSWDYGQDPAATEFEFQMNTLANNPFAGLPDGNLPW